MGAFQAAAAVQAAGPGLGALLIESTALSDLGPVPLVQVPTPGVRPIEDRTTFQPTDARTQRPICCWPCRRTMPQDDEPFERLGLTPRDFPCS